MINMKKDWYEYNKKHRVKKILPLFLTILVYFKEDGELGHRRLLSTLKCGYPYLYYSLMYLIKLGYLSREKDKHSNNYIITLTKRGKVVKRQLEVIYDEIVKAKRTINKEDST